MNRLPCAVSRHQPAGMAAGLALAVGVLLLTRGDPSESKAPGPRQAVARLVSTLSASDDRLADVNDLLSLSAGTGEVLHRLSYICAVLNRTVFDANNDSNWPQQPPVPFPPFIPLPERLELGPASTLGEVNTVFDVIGETYGLYSNKHRRVGIGNSRKPLFAVTRRCESNGPCPMPNAFWSGLPVASFPGGRQLLQRDDSNHQTHETQGLQWHCSDWTMRPPPPGAIPAPAPSARPERPPRERPSHSSTS